MGLLGALAGLIKPAPPLDPATREALERIFDLVDPFLRTDANVEHKLAAPVRHALAYCDHLVAALPGVIDVGRQTFSTQPLVHALFATADDIGRMLGGSQAIRDFLEQAGSTGDHFYTLLAARRQEKRQLGFSRQGEVIYSGVPQTVLYFSDHVLVEPQADLDTTRAHLRRAAFDSLLKSFHAHVAALRQEKRSLAADCSMERAQLTTCQDKKGEAGCAFSTRHLAELDAQLRQVAESLLPEHLEDALAAFLLAPEISLRLDMISCLADRLGILVDADTPDGVRLTFAELCARDRRRHLVMLARIDRAEAESAVAACQDEQRRFLMI